MDHETVAYDDQTEIGTVSITDYAQKSLGDVVYVGLPQEGSDIVQGGESCVHVSALRPPTLHDSSRSNWRCGEREGSVGHRECRFVTSTG